MVSWTAPRCITVSSNSAYYKFTFLSLFIPALLNLSEFTPLSNPLPKSETQQSPSAISLLTTSYFSPCRMDSILQRAPTSPSSLSAIALLQAIIISNPDHCRSHLIGLSAFLHSSSTLSAEECCQHKRYTMPFTSSIAYSSTIG